MAFRRRAARFPPSAKADRSVPTPWLSPRAGPRRADTFGGRSVGHSLPSGGSTPKTSEFLELFIFNDLWHVFGGVEADLRLRNMRGPGAAYVVRVGRFSRQLSLERKTGIAPFERLVAQVMGQEPY